MIYHGRFKGGVVILDTPASLPDGTPVRVEPLGPSQQVASEHENARCGRPDAGKRPRSGTARTSLGRRLYELREQYLATGAPLLTWGQIEQEVQERRGERDPGDER